MPKGIQKPLLEKRQQYNVQKKKDKTLHRSSNTNPWVNSGAPERWQFLLHM
jgi:hypothetical protein